MTAIENMSFAAAILVFAASLIFSVIMFAVRKKQPKTDGGFQKWDYIGMGLTALGLLLLTATITARTITTGHGPFSNMYEFSIAFVWGIALMSLFFQWRYRTQVLKGIDSLVGLALLLFANTLPSKPVPLVPALQQSFLLSAHVASAVIAYGTFTMGFGASLLYLIRSRRDDAGGASLETLSDMSYTAVKIGFPFMTLLIILGALWADVAWGKYWSWDPKETASLVTWLIFASYLHARVVRGWKGKPAALILIIGFAAVLFTFFGNYVFSGLHSYG